MEFKDKLKSLRLKNNLSQEALAKKIYVSRSSIAKWENGLGIPSDANLQELCKHFNVDENWLLDRNDLKKQIKSTVKQIPPIVISVFGFITPLIYVILGFCLTFKEHISISAYYPPVHLFDFIVNYIDEKYYALKVLLWCAVVVWIATVTFAVLTMIINKLRRRARTSFCINFCLIVLSLSIFLILFFVTINISHPVYEFYS